MYIYIHTYINTHIKVSVKVLVKNMLQQAAKVAMPVFTCRQICQGGRNHRDKIFLVLDANPATGKFEVPPQAGRSGAEADFAASPASIQKGGTPQPPV